jgi:hypothetical protein
VTGYLYRFGARLMHLFMVQVWCMVDALVHGTGFMQVGAWLMHLFMVQVDYRLSYRLVHGWCTCLWYKLITC